MKTPVVCTVILLLKIDCQRFLLLTHQGRVGRHWIHCTKSLEDREACLAFCTHSVTPLVFDTPRN